jgi:hypothetical protein
VQNTAVRMISDERTRSSVGAEPAGTPRSWPRIAWEELAELNRDQRYEGLRQGHAKRRTSAKREIFGSDLLKRAQDGDDE